MKFHFIQKDYLDKRLPLIKQGIMIKSFSFLEFIYVNATLRLNFLLSLIFTLVYYFPSLRNSSRDAGFLYGGDVLGFYWPSLQKAQSLISSFNFTAIDVSQFNGAADFFLTSNFFAVNPMFVVYSLISVFFTAPNARVISQVLVIMLAIHSFIACYFTIKLLTRFCRFSFGLAAFAGVFYAFSIGMLTALNEPQFVLCTAVLPWCIYASLSFERDMTFARLFVASFSVILALLGGYIPLGVATIALAVAAVLYIQFVLDERVALNPNAIGRALSSMAPFAVASLVIAPYLAATYIYLKQTPSANTGSLFYSAHQLSELPQSILRIISFRYEVPGYLHEFSVQWGLIALTIALLFVSSRKLAHSLSHEEDLLFKFCAIGYTATVLSIFGPFSAVADMVYYFVPQVGSMHIYQRFLLPANFLLGIMLALMLRTLIMAETDQSFRIVSFILITFTLGSAFVCARYATQAGAIGLNSYLIFELILCSIFAISLTFRGTNFKIVSAIILCTLPTLNFMYQYSHLTNGIAVRKAQQPVLLDPIVQKNIVQFFQSNTNKDLIKYVDLTPMWSTAGIESFSKTFPYFVLDAGKTVSSYHGFNFYLSPRADYMARMPVRDLNQLRPDWSWVKSTGADYVVARGLDLAGLAQANLISRSPGRAELRLPNDIVIVPLLRSVAAGSSPEQAFDNGYVRVATAIANSQASTSNLAANRIARQSSTLGNATAALAVDGNTSGTFAVGSVTHTLAEARPWLEIDLGSVEAIDSIKVWNRTDCCGERLRNLWVFVSEKPFPNEPVDAEQQVQGIWSQFTFEARQQVAIQTGGITGRYVRLQAGDKDGPATNFLSVAEVQVLQNKEKDAVRTAEKPFEIMAFSTNDANRLKVDIDAKQDVEVEYLMWKNPRLSYYLDGKSINPMDRDGLQVIKVPTGRHVVEIRYTNRLLSLFWIVYALFGFGLIVSLLYWLIAGRGARARSGSGVHPAAVHD